MLLMAPVLIILWLAVIEFGMILAVNKQVAAASQYGARLVSEAGTPGNVLALVSGGTLRARIDQQLQTGGIPAGACNVTVQYTDNAGTPQPDAVSQPAGAEACPCTPSLVNLPAAPPSYVRVTVCAYLNRTGAAPGVNPVPDLLAPFGFSIADRRLQHQTTYRLE